MTLPPTSSGEAMDGPYGEKVRGRSHNAFAIEEAADEFFVVPGVRMRTVSRYSTNPNFQRRFRGNPVRSCAVPGRSARKLHNVRLNCWLVVRRTGCREA